MRLQRSLLQAQWPHCRKASEWLPIPSTWAVPPQSSGNCRKCRNEIAQGFCRETTRDPPRMLAVKTLAPNHILTHIVDAKRERLSRTKMRVPEAVVKHFASKVPPQRSFREALLTSDRPVRIIAEIKKASPSKGVFTEHFSAQALADIYARAGASAISAVTEEDFFQGNIGWIEDIRKIADLPVLRKDFVFDPYQVYETRGAKASAILLIVAMLRPEELHSLLGVAQLAGLDALVEVHNEEELREAIDAGADIIGVNNRDLKTFDV